MVKWIFDTLPAILACATILFLGHIYTAMAERDYPLPKYYNGEIVHIPRLKENARVEASYCRVNQTSCEYFIRLSTGLQVVAVDSDMEPTDDPIEQVY